MLRTSFKIVLALLFAAAAYLFYQAGVSEDTAPQPFLTMADAPAEVLTIAFGSCNRQDKPQDYWTTIGRHQPDVWLWLGDIVYADTKDMKRLAADYEQQKTAPQYAAFTAATPHVYGVWDDHDYGLNDGGKEWPYKDPAKVELLRFLDVPSTAAVHNRAGAYQSYVVGTGERSVKVILLDTRYFRDPVAPPTVKGHRYGQNATGDILGEAQWAWLENELTNSTAAAHVIASSIQVLPQEHGYEKWDNFPAARQRLLALLAATRPNLPLLLSGDRHLAEISNVAVNDYPIYEVTSSGLTHSYDKANEPNGHRISPLVGEKNYGLLHYVWRAAGPELLAEVRGIAHDKVLASLSLNQQLVATDKEALYKILNADREMPDQLKPCPQTPNCVSTQTDQPAKKRAPIAYTGSAAAAQERIKRVLSDLKRATLVEEADGYLHYTFKTWPIPFIDDVEFLFDQEAKMIHYRSASRVGHSDLGVNAKRMAKIVALLE